MCFLLMYLVISNSFSFECRQSNSPLSFFAIYTKVAVETFAWGVGTAVGELPPYFVARAGILSLISALQFII